MEHPHHARGRSVHILVPHAHACCIGVDTTDASASNTGALQLAGGMGIKKTGYFGTGVNIVSGGLSVTAGGGVTGEDRYMGARALSANKND